MKKQESKETIRKRVARWRQNNPKKDRQHKITYNRSVNGLLINIHRNMRARSRKAGVQCLSKQEFIDWATTSKEFKNLYDVWVRSDHTYRLTPSVDRIIPGAAYTLDNIQWLTVSENARKKDKLILAVSERRSNNRTVLVKSDSYNIRSPRP